MKHSAKKINKEIYSYKGVEISRCEYGTPCGTVGAWNVYLGTKSYPSTLKEAKAIVDAHNVQNPEQYTADMIAESLASTLEDWAE